MPRCLSPAHARPAPPQRAARSALTLIEIVITVAIIAVLAGMMVPVVAMVRRGVHQRTAGQVVDMLHQAIEAYRQDDAQHRLPAQPNADRSLSRRETDDARTASGTLELIESRGLHAAAEQPRDAEGRLLDPWGNPYRYWPSMLRSEVVPDAVLPGWNWDSAANRPAAWGRRPDPATGVLADGGLLYAYVWSTGRAPADAAASWIHPQDVRR